MKTIVVIVILLILGVAGVSHIKKNAREIDEAIAASESVQNVSTPVSTTTPAVQPVVITPQKPVETKKVVVVEKKPEVTATVAVAPATSLKVISPNGGESFEKGTAVTVTYNAGNQVGKGIRMYLINEESSQSWEVAGNDSVKAGNQILYMIIPPTAPVGSKYKVRIKVYDPAIDTTNLVDKSDNYFSIK